MALDDTAVNVASTGHILLGNVGATRPTATALGTFVTAGTLPTGFTELGHTAADDVLAFGQDDGDTSVLASWQNAQLREVVTSQAIDYFVIKALQIDNTNLALYYGGGDATGTDIFALPDTPAPTEKATAVVIVDGTNVVTFYAPKASIRREDAPEFQTDDFSAWPLRFTILKPSSGAKGFWIGSALGA